MYNEALMKIQFINGPNQGKQFTVEAGLVLSRKEKQKGDIAVLDPKASNPHAEIVKKRTRFFLKDLDSKNGTSVNNDIKDLFVLKPGLKFFIGSTGFKVLDSPKPAKKKKKPLEVKKNWREQVAAELTKHLEGISDVSDKKILPVFPVLQLTFKSGAQKGEVWLIYYGPRQAGSACVDLPVLESSAPPECFTLHPKASGEVVFHTAYPKQVLLNKKHQRKKTLQKGDIITFSNVSITADFLLE